MISLRPERKLLNMCFKRIEAVVTLRISHSLAYFQAADRVLAEERPELRNTTDWKHLYTSLRRRWAPT